MDRQEIKQKWLDIMARLFREDWMDDEDHAECVDEVMGFIGGWDKFYRDIETGVSNGYSEEVQLALLERMLINGNPLTKAM